MTDEPITIYNCPFIFFKGFSFFKKNPLFNWQFLFPGGSDGEDSAWNAGDLSSIPGLGRCPGEGNGYSLQFS